MESEGSQSQLIGSSGADSGLSAQVLRVHVNWENVLLENLSIWWELTRTTSHGELVLLTYQCIQTYCDWIEQSLIFVVSPLKGKYVWEYWFDKILLEVVDLLELQIGKLNRVWIKVCVASRHELVWIYFQKWNDGVGRSIRRSKIAFLYPFTSRVAYIHDEAPGHHCYFISRVTACLSLPRKTESLVSNSLTNRKLFIILHTRPLLVVCVHGRPCIPPSYHTLQSHSQHTFFLNYQDCCGPARISDSKLFTSTISVHHTESER